MKNTEAEDRRAAEKLFCEAIVAYKLYHLTEKKAAAKVSKLLAASEKAMAAYYKAYNKIAKKYVRATLGPGRNAN